MSPLGRVRARVSGRWAALKERYAWLRHVVAAWDRLQSSNGNQYAAAITYFSFLALFPLLLLAASITGFVLHSHPAAEQSFFNQLTEQIPGSLGGTLKSSLQAAVRSRTALGIGGLIGVLLTGLGWIGNLRTAIDAVWGRTAPAMNFVKIRLVNLFILAGLGLGAVVSLALTVVGTSLTDQILAALNLDGVTGSHVVLKVTGIALAVLGDMLIFYWLLIRLPQMDVPVRIAMKGVLLAAVGFEALKIIGTYTVAHTADSPTAGPFAGVLAVLIWIQLVARFMLFACAWTATLASEHRVAAADQPQVTEPAVAAGDADPEIPPAAVERRPKRNLRQSVQM